MSRGGWCAGSLEVQAGGAADAADGIATIAATAAIASKASFGYPCPEERHESSYRQPVESL